jgi:hypothetical protein
LEKYVCDSTCSIEESGTKQQILENIRKPKLQGTYSESKGRWVEEGEKPSKYLCALESRNFT